VAFCIVLGIRSASPSTQNACCLPIRAMGKSKGDEAALNSISCTVRNDGSGLKRVTVSLVSIR